MKLSLKGLTGAATMLAAALGLNLLGPHRAYSAPGSLALPGESDLGVTILSPDPHLSLSGPKPVEISAFYQGTPANQIIAVELYLDGARVAAKTLDVPETRGVVSFLVDSAQLSAGTHKIVIRATAADQEVKSAKSAFAFGADSGSELVSPSLPLPGGPSATSDAAPTLHLIAPSDDHKVQGVVTLRVEATDPSGKPPYVSLFIDKTFKTLRNFAPYEFEWDTTAYPNGVHTIEVFGYNDSPNVGHSKVLQLYVNNPGGETHIRRDLLDNPPLVRSAFQQTPVAAAKRTAAVPRKSQGRPLPLRRPDALMASLIPTRASATRDLRRQMAHAAESALHFGSLNIDAGLSSPFAAEAVAPAAVVPPAIALTPTQGYKPMPAPAVVTAPLVDPQTAALAATPSVRRSAFKIARLQRMAAFQMPSHLLDSAFLVAPHLAPLTAAPEIKIASYQGEMRFAHTVLRPALQMHPLHVHFPASLGSLLRSVGQTSLLFNHTTVKLDRPISAQGNIVFGPLRQIFEQDGGTLTWQSRTGTVHAKNATKDIVLTIGQSQALVNAHTVMLEGKPYLLTGRTMVPLSFVSTALDADVQYDAVTGHLLITSRK